MVGMSGAEMQPPGDDASTPPAEMSDEEIDQELLRLGEQWDQINDPNNAMTSEQREVARQRHAQRVHDLEQECQRRNP